MPLVESEAIILRSAALGEADKMVSFFSRRLGRLQGVAPYARKSRRRFGAALEPLTHARLWFFQRESRTLVRLSQSELIASYWKPGGDYQRTLAFNHIVELVELLLPEQEPAERMFRLTLMTLEALQQDLPLWLPLAYFHLWSVRLAGWLPPLDRCTHCQRPFAPAATVWAQARTAHLLCQSCQRRGLLRLSPAERELAAAMLAHPLPGIVTRCRQASSPPALERFLLDLIEHHAERKLATRPLFHEKG